MGRFLGSPTTPLVAPKTPSPVSGWRGQRAQHLPWDSVLWAVDADETLCQGSSSARGDSKGQPMKVLALLQIQPWAQLHAAQGTASSPGHLFPTLLPRDGGLTATNWWQTGN